MNKRVEEELEKRRDEIEQEVKRRVEAAKAEMEHEMMLELERRREQIREEERRREVGARFQEVCLLVGVYKNVLPPSLINLLTPNYCSPFAGNRSHHSTHETRFLLITNPVTLIVCFVFQPLKIINPSCILNHLISIYILPIPSGGRNITK